MVEISLTQKFGKGREVKMYKSFFILILLVMGLAAQQPAVNLKVMSLNIRYDNADDGINAWPERTELIVQTLAQEAPDVLGLQEALFRQLTFLDSALTNYRFYGIGRTDGVIKGEFSPIFYKKDRFLLAFARTFWLSAQPDVPGSIGPGAQFPRIFTLIRLFDLQSGKNIWIGNTHFSHVSDSARTLAARILLEKAKQYCASEPFVLMGDFNAEQGSQVYQTLIGDDSLQLIDSYFHARQGHSGGEQTYNAFGKNQSNTIIDHIFCNQSFQVLKHYFLPVKKDDVFISDHFPVVAVLKLKLNKLPEKK